MINLKKLRKSKGFKIIIPDTDIYNEPESIKHLREDKFRMSQAAFAKAIGVSVKTVENWENRNTVNKLPDITKKMLYLLDKYPALMKDLYMFVDNRDILSVDDQPQYSIIEAQGTTYGRWQPSKTEAIERICGEEVLI